MSGGGPFQAVYVELAEWRRRHDPPELARRVLLFDREAFLTETGKEEEDWRFESGFVPVERLDDHPSLRLAWEEGLLMEMTVHPEEEAD